MTRAAPVLTEDILSLIPRFFERGAGPSHDDLSRLFDRFGFSKADPAVDSTQTVGKVKRLRAVLAVAIEEDPEAGGRLMREPGDTRYVLLNSMNLWPASRLAPAPKGQVVRTFTGPYEFEAYLYEGFGPDQRRRVRAPTAKVRLIDREAAGDPG